MGSDWEPRRTNATTESNTTKYRYQFLLNEYSVNFKASIFIGETNNRESITVIIIIPCQLSSSGYCSCQKGSPDTKKAAAGVGIPIKVLVCLVSTLNFARRKAENRANANAT